MARAFPFLSQGETLNPRWVTRPATRRSLCVTSPLSPLRLEGVLTPFPPNSTFVSRVGSFCCGLFAFTWYQNTRGGRFRLSTASPVDAMRGNRGNIYVLAHMYEWSPGRAACPQSDLPGPGLRRSEEVDFWFSTSSAVICAYLSSHIWEWVEEKLYSTVSSFLTTSSHIHPLESKSQLMIVN